MVFRRLRKRGRDRARSSERRRLGKAFPKDGPTTAKFLRWAVASPTLGTTFNTYNNGIDSKHVSFEVGRLLIFLGVGSFFTSYLGGVGPCVTRGGGSKIGQKSVTSFMDGPGLIKPL